MNLSSLFQDVRMAFRSMSRERIFTITAVATLALGVGANTALFSVVYGVLLRPLPYRDPGGLVRLSEYHPGATSGVSGAFFTNITYYAWTAPKTLEGFAGFSSASFADTTRQETVMVEGASIAPALFGLLGVQPAIGRFLVEADAAEGAPPVAVISDDFWRDRFGEERSVVGKTLTLDGSVRTIVGVAPRGFYFPGREAQVWTPMTIARGSADPKNQSIRLFGAIGRLKPGRTEQQAAEEGTIAARSVPRPPVANALFGKGGPVAIKVETILSDLTAGVKPALILFSVGVGFILLIACANVASLQLARGLSRQRELAIRAALGAGRARVVQLLVTESLLLSALGGALGVLLGSMLLRVLPAVAPASFPRVEDITLDGHALAFSALASVVAGLASGLLPAFRASSPGLAPALRDGVGASASAVTQRLRNGLVVIEVALAVMLLVGALLLARSFFEILNVDPGYDPGHVIVARIEGASRDVPSEKTLSLAADVLGRVRALPGVTAAGVSNMTPLDHNTAVASFELPDPKAPEGRISARATAYTVTPGYAEALSLRLKAGRFLREEDMAAATPVVVVNEEFVRAYLDDGKPVLGRLLPNLARGQEGVMTEVVGVVTSVLKDGFDVKPRTEMFGLPRFGRQLPSGFQIAVRTSGDPAALGPELRAIMRDLSPSTALGLVTLDQRVRTSLAQPRFAAITIALFALLSLSLSAGGLYGAMSYGVNQRRREIGVRSALGATRRDIVSLVVRQGMVVTFAGLALGLGAALVSSKAMTAILFGVTPLDPLAFMAAPAVLLLFAAAACVFPARRGAAVSPTEALRCE